MLTVAHMPGGSSAQLLRSSVLKTTQFTSTPQLPFKIPHKPTNRDQKALNRDTLGALGLVGTRRPQMWGVLGTSGTVKVWKDRRQLQEERCSSTADCGPNRYCMSLGLSSEA